MGKVFFFEKKKQKTFARCRGLSDQHLPRDIKVFWFFFSKKNAFLACLSALSSLGGRGRWGSSDACWKVSFRWTDVDKYVTIGAVQRPTRPISWIKAARKDFGEFPKGARDDALDALSAIAEGAMPSTAKVLTGLGSGVMEVALRTRAMHTALYMRFKLGRKFGLFTPFKRNRRPEYKRRRRRLTLCVNVSSG